MACTANLQDRFERNIKSEVLEKQVDPKQLLVLKGVIPTNKGYSKAAKIRNKLVRLINNIGQVCPYTCRRTNWQVTGEAAKAMQRTRRVGNLLELVHLNADGFRKRRTWPDQKSNPTSSVRKTRLVVANSSAERHRTGLTQIEERMKRLRHKRIAKNLLLLLRFNILLAV
ncbi:uncharacterized protein LOC118468437 [Anopheles albimanus]|uniref:uncharacterized protein LOC118468437 n=1 Tax=Anopheles albimanus TaxID=7167 RepID=UPI001641A843|nr:uncharacterized protein LOC118468437 [Anopheles albimanus]